MSVNNEKKKRVKKVKKSLPKHVVVFQNMDGSVLKTAFVAHGQAAEPPAPPQAPEADQWAAIYEEMQARERDQATTMPESKPEVKSTAQAQSTSGARPASGAKSASPKSVKKDLPPDTPSDAHYNIQFDGWDHDYTKVTSNLVLKPRWKWIPKNYLVMYFHENGSMLGMESVPYGSPATIPCKPVKDSDEEYNYPFIGWSCNLDSIQGDTRAKAIFGRVRKVFLVSFYHEDGSLLKKEKVHYNESAHPPINVDKPSDLVYHYRFAGWSYSDDQIAHIRSSLNVHAVFEEIYNDYTVDFYDEDLLHKRETLHYGDPILYPPLSRKGYDLTWDRHPDRIQTNEELHASWSFSNTLGKVMDHPQGSFRITDPSIHNGKVCCLSFTSKGEKRVVLPSQVKLGDYYYTITEIGPEAFRSCKGMEWLILPDTLQYIQDRGLADCPDLREITFGKGIKRLGKAVFARDYKLQRLSFKGKKIPDLTKGALNKAPRKIKNKKLFDFCVDK